MPQTCSPPFLTIRSICDFGLSRIIEEDSEDGADAGGQTLYVVTRWYRAPEVLLGYTHYDSGIDLWSLGCIFGELLYRRPLLNGENFVNQLEKINDFIGTPSPDDLWYDALLAAAGMPFFLFKFRVSVLSDALAPSLSRYVTNEKARNFMMNVLPKKPGVDMAAKFPGASPEALDLLKELLRVDPKKRINSAGALAHPYLASVREAAEYEVVAEGPVDLDDIEVMELTEINLKRMMFQEIVHFHELK